MAQGWSTSLSNKTLESIRFASLLSHVPEFRWRDIVLPHRLFDELKTGREYMLALKRGCNQPDGLLSIYDSVAKWCVDCSLFPDFFSKGTILVPVPNSALARPDTLWAPKLLAEALARQELGSGVVTCLSRVVPVPSSALSRPQDRATPAEHRDSIQVQRMLADPENILLVNDSVTRGSTFLGIACKIAEMYPNTCIKAFAAMGTVSNVNKFIKVMNPCTGTITSTDNGSSRRDLD